MKTIKILIVNISFIPIYACGFDFNLNENEITLSKLVVYLVLFLLVLLRMIPTKNNISPDSWLINILKEISDALNNIKPIKSNINKNLNQTK